MQKIIAGLFILIAVTANAETLTGKVVGVHDGDTLTLLSSGNVQTKVRLAEIDTPESNQPYGTQAKKSLSDMVYGQNARVEVAEKDRYGRTVGRVYVGNVDVNRELVRSGSAWVYRQYLSDKSLLAVEDEAKTAKRGLWGLPDAQRIPPWEWRRGKPVAATVAPVTATPGQCGSKRYCKEMVDCAEARFYLTNCGLKSLDGNGDGVPCETLCR